MGIYSRNGVIVHDMLYSNDVLTADIDKMADVTAEDFVTKGLIGYWDASWLADESTTWLDKSTAYQTGSHQNHRQRHNMLLVNGAKFAYYGSIPTMVVDGVNDYGYVNEMATYGSQSMTASTPGDRFLHHKNLKNLTYEFWFRTSGSTFSSNGNLYGAIYNNGTRLRFSSGNPGSSFMYVAGMLLGANIGGNWTGGAWQHLVVTLWISSSANDELRVYRNSASVGSDLTGKYTANAGGLPFSATQGLFLLGTWNGATEMGNFAYNRVRVYERPLSAAEIAQNYNAERRYFGL
jgi:hypothetical protein